MKLKRIVTMGITALMAASAMSVSAFAAEDENINFYNSVQVLTFNSETGSFDSSYEPASQIAPMTLPNYTFTFNQTITTSGSYLKNLDTGDDSYLITDDDTIILRLDKKPAKTLRLQVCKRDGSILGPTGDIKTSQTVFKMSGLNKYYNSIGTCKIHLKTLSGSATISGTLRED